MAVLNFFKTIESQRIEADIFKMFLKDGVITKRIIVDRYSSFFGKKSTGYQEVLKWLKSMVEAKVFIQVGDRECLYEISEQYIPTIKCFCEYIDKITEMKDKTDLGEILTKRDWKSESNKKYYEKNKEEIKDKNRKYQREKLGVENGKRKN